MYVTLQMLGIWNDTDEGEDKITKGEIEAKEPMEVVQ